MIRLSRRLQQWWFQRVKYAFDAVAAMAAFILVLPIF